MNYLLYFFQIVIIQYTAAQVITLGGRNFIPNLNNQNCGNIPLAANFANNAGMLANIGQTSQLANNMQLSTQDIVNANLLNNNAYSLANGNIGLASGNLPINNIAQDIVNANLINNDVAYGISNGNVANIGLASNNIGLGSNNIGLASNNIGLSSNNIGLASNNIGYASNIGSEVICNTAPSYANVVQPPRDYGIEFSSGALQVGGTVEVNGRMPFNANVAVNGAVPAQGLGAVNYSCDQLSTDES